MSATHTETGMPLLKKEALQETGAHVEQLLLACQTAGGNRPIVDLCQAVEKENEWAAKYVAKVTNALALTMAQMGVDPTLVRMLDMAITAEFLSFYRALERQEVEYRAESMPTSHPHD